MNLVLPDYSIGDFKLFTEMLTSSEGPIVPGDEIILTQMLKVFGHDLKYLVLEDSVDHQDGDIVNNENWLENSQEHFNEDYLEEPIKIENYELKPNLNDDGDHEFIKCKMRMPASASTARSFKSKILR